MGGSFTSTVMRVALASVVAWSAAGAGVQRAFHVSPSGDDAAAGTEAAPFRSLAKARDAVRAANAAMTGDLEVVLHDGVYRLDEPFVLEAADSGTDGHRVVYRAANAQKAVLSGGRPITGWRKSSACAGAFHRPCASAFQPVTGRPPLSTAFWAFAAR